jgi:LacI family transcriptional regulator
VNNKPGVSNDTRERVLDVVEELGYIAPTRLPLLSSKVSHLGAVVRRTGYPLTSDPFYGEIFQGIEKTCHDYQISVAFGILDYNQNGLRSRPALLRDERIGGLVILGAVPCEIIELLWQDAQLPMVLVDNDFPLCPWDTVMMDNRNGAYLATRHLIGYGHRRIAFFGGPDHPSINERREGYEKALGEHGSSPWYVPTEDLNPGNGEQAVVDLLREQPETTAIFCANDLVAIGALQKFQQLGFNVPEDFSIVGFDDIYTVSFTSPPITTIHVDRASMGQIAAELLLGRITNLQRAAIKTTITVQLMERGSVGAPRPCSIHSAEKK